MNSAWLSPVLLSLQLAATTTFILLLLGVALAWWIHKSKNWLRAPLEALVTVPLVLPPTVLGFYLLLLLGPGGPIAPLSLVFSFAGLVVGSVVFSLPFMVRPVLTSFDAIDKGIDEAGALLGAPPLARFWRISLPLARPGILSGMVLSFAHTLGEFGVVLMIGGNIPDKTRVLSIAVFDAVEQLDYMQAHLLAGLLVSAALVALALVSWLQVSGTNRWRL